MGKKNQRQQKNLKWYLKQLMVLIMLSELLGSIAVLLVSTEYHEDYLYLDNVKRHVISKSR